MAASDHLSGPQFYHSTSAHLGPGALIAPGHAGHAVSSPGHVYMGTSPGRVRVFGELAAQRDSTPTYQTYQVQPTGPVETDPQSNGLYSKHPLRVVGLHSKGKRPAPARYGSDDEALEVEG